MKSKTKLAIGDCAYIFSTRISTCSPSLVLRNWLLLYFSVKTKSLVHYHFLNIHIVFAVRCAYLRACADATRINEALHPNRSHWKHLSLRDQRNDSSWYNEPDTTLYGADALEHAALLSMLFYFPIIIWLVQWTFRFVMCSESKASYWTVQYEYVYRYTYNIYIPILYIDLFSFLFFFETATFDCDFWMYIFTLFV